SPTPADVGYELLYEVTATSAVAEGTAKGLTHTTTADSMPTRAVSEAPPSSGACAGPCLVAGGGDGGAGAPGGNGGNGAGASVNVGTLGLAPTGSAAHGARTRWLISLNVRPKRVHRHSRIDLSGRVATSPRPAAGKLVYLQARELRVVRRRMHGHMRTVRAYGRWITFMVLRAAPSGAFKATYRFRLGGRHSYQFRAVAPAEGAYLNFTGTSGVVTVNER
ncbi:MAG: hypothetical protein ACYDA6_10200, partial [Solirubrobacteraceae bacterium]